MLNPKTIKQQLSNQFVRNVGWLGLGELIGRVFRLGIVVVIARILTPHDYGLAAIILTVKEFSQVLTLEGGVAGKLIQADEKDVEVLANTAYWLNWILCSSLFVIQCIAAFPVAYFYSDSRLILPICIIGLEYFAIPTYSVQMALITRENRMKIPAIAATLRTILFSTLALLLALSGFGLWSIILPHVLVTPVTFILANTNHPWRPKQSFSLHRWNEILDFSKNVVGSQLMRKTRANLDYLLVGGILGVEALGLYYFAYNSGIGISLNVMHKLSSAQFPYICAVRTDLKKFRERYFKTLKVIALVIIPFVCLQTSMAQFYVPIVFGKQWIPAIPILMLICLSAIPRAFGFSGSLLLQSIGRADLDFKWNVIFTAFFATVLVIVVKAGLVAVATAVLLSHVLAISIFCIWAIRFAFKDADRVSLSSR